jgi:hypothetical protein
MSITFNGVTLRGIRNVRKCGVENGVYFAEVELSMQEGFPFEWCNYCARADDLAVTGKWVYEQIVAGNFEGEMGQETVVYPDEAPQPATQGAQTL